MQDRKMQQMGLAYLERIIVTDDPNHLSPAALRMVASDTQMRAYALELFRFRIVTQILPKALDRLEVILASQVASAATQLQAVKLTAELAGLLGSPGGGGGEPVGEAAQPFGGAVAGARDQAEVGREALVRMEALERRLKLLAGPGHEAQAPVW